MQKKNIDFSYFYVNSPKKKTENIISQNNVCDDSSFFLFAMMVLSLQLKKKDRKKE